MRIALTTLGTLVLVSGSALAQSSRDLVVTDAQGSRIVRQLLPAFGAYDAGFGTRGGSLLWTYPDPVSITESVAVGDADGNDSWVAHNLNDERLSLFDTTGAGTPAFSYSMSVENPSTVGVDCATDADLAAVISFPIGGPITVRGFTRAGGNTPAWTYTFGAAYNNSGKRAVAVSGDGTRVAAAAYDGTNTLLVVLNSSGGVVNSTTYAGFSSGVELCDDGSRACLTHGAVARVIDTATMVELHSITVSGSGGYHRISRDGTAVAAGGFNIRAAREVAGVWSSAYVGTGSTDWFGYGVALSGDGRTLFVASHDYNSGYLPNDYRVVDLSTSSVVASGGYVGSGANQNSIAGAQANDDGTLFAMASWGDAGNTQPEVRIFDRDLNLVGSIDTPGSPFEIDMTPDGHYVLVGSKAVHANDLGSGGNTYAYENDIGCAADLNGDGMANGIDVGLFLQAYSTMQPEADFNGDGVWNGIDVGLFLQAYAQGC